MNSSYDLVEIARKLSNLMMAGVVYEADYLNARLKVKSGDLTTSWVPWLTTRAGADKSWWAPEVGEQVLLLCPDGNPAQAWVLPAAFTDAHSAPESSPDISAVHFSDDAVFRYNRAAHTLDIILPASAKVNIVSKGGCTITGNLKVIGSIKSTKNITDKNRSMAADRKIYNGHNHSGQVPPPSKTQ